MPSLLLSLVFLTTTSASAQTTPSKSGDEAAERFLKAETAKLQSRFLDGATTLKEWQDRLPRLKREYMDMLGLSPLPERTPLQATVTGTVTRDTVAIAREPVHG